MIYQALALLLLIAAPAAAQRNVTEVRNVRDENLRVEIAAGANSLATEATQIAISTTLTAIKDRADLLATEATSIVISTTATAIKERADLLATEATLATRGSEATSVAISTTLAAIKTRADLLATEVTLLALKNRADLLASEATATAISTTATAIKTRADLLGTEATLATRASEATALAISTTATAIKLRADLLATEAKQDTGNASLSSIDGKMPANPATDRATAAAPFSARLSDGAAFYKATTPADTQPISAASLPLPGGAATENTQIAVSTTLAALNSKIGSELILNSTSVFSVGMDREAYETESGKMFSFAVEFNLPSNGTETDAILFVNLSTNTVKMRVWKISQDIITSARNATFRIYTNPVVSSSGTAQGIYNRLIGSSGLSQARAFAGPTISSRGSLAASSSGGQNSNTLYIEMASTFILPPGNKILITGTPDGNNTAVSIGALWAERP